MDKEFDNELKGYLWHENDCEVHRKGSITINGKKRYFAVAESKNDKGEPKFELLMSVGLLYANSAVDKLSDKSPDIGGRVTIDGQMYTFGGWKKESSKGLPYTDVSLREHQESKAPF